MLMLMLSVWRRKKDGRGSRERERKGGRLFGGCGGILVI
jgi:hypothetical protein